MPVQKKHNGKSVVGYTATEMGHTDSTLTKDENNPARMFWYYKNSDGTTGDPMNVKDQDEMLGLMDYKKAKQIRKKSFGTLIAEQEGGLGESIKSAISQKTKAKVMGIKEAFDPMNIAKKMTFGSNWAPAMMGKAMGRKQEDIAHFTGANIKTSKLGRTAALNLKDNDDTEDAPTPAIESVKAIYKILKDREKQTKDWNKNDDKFDRTDKKQENLRHQELLKALSLRRAKKEKEEPTKKKVEEEKKEQPKVEKPKAEPTKKKGAEKAPKKEEVKPTEKAPPKEPKKTAEKVQKEKPKEVKKEAEKPKEVKKEPEKVPKKEEPTPQKPAEKVPSKEVAKPSAEKISEPQQLGKLSSKFETGGAKNAAAIVGWDSTGGTSYGTYQIASKVGAMSSFLAFAQAKGETDIVSRLKSAGPADTGGKSGPFVDEWKKIAAEKGASFEKLQHDFIEDSQYKPAAQTLLKGTGYDVEKQSPAIKDVFFSTVVQHGPGSPKYNNGAYGIFKKAIDDNGGSGADPKKIISSVYEIRATKFSSSTEKVRESVQKRFVQEKSLALDMLNQSGQQIDQSSKENSQIRGELNKDTSSSTTLNNTTVNQSVQSTSSRRPRVDDRPALVVKGDKG
jgi:hypothetical protein